MKTKYNLLDTVRVKVITHTEGITLEGSREAVINMIEADIIYKKEFTTKDNIEGLPVHIFRYHIVSDMVTKREAKWVSEGEILEEGI